MGGLDPAACQPASQYGLPTPPPPMLLSLEPLQEPFWLPVLSDASAAGASVCQTLYVLPKPLTLPLQKKKDLFSSVSNWNAEHIFPKT